MRKNIVAGNWKMNLNTQEAGNLLERLLNYSNQHQSNCEVFVAPPAIYLAKAVHILQASSVKVFAQDVSQYQSGAYTGEISAEMLSSMHVDGSIVGHSERRKYYNEDDDQIAAKIKQLLSANLNPIYCNGETLEERKAGKYFDIIKSQTETALFQLSAEEIKKVVIAYEPVWAIGTGETASPEQAQEVHAYIRELIAGKYGAEVANEISILYGGSVKPGNAKEIFSQPDVDGGLIGGAALNIDDFSGIIEAFN